MNEELHAKLIALQPMEELERKWKKAKGRHSNRFWAAEWIDLAERRADILYEALHRNNPEEHARF